MLFVTLNTARAPGARDLASTVRRGIGDGLSVGTVAFGGCSKSSTSGLAYRYATVTTSRVPCVFFMSLLMLYQT